MSSTALFEKCGISASEVAKFQKNAALCGTLERLIDAAGIRESGAEAAVGKLLYQLATKVTKATPGDAAALVARLIARGAIDKVRINAALSLLMAHNYDADGPLTEAALVSACGIGVVVTPDQIAAAVNKALADDAVKAELAELRYHFNLGARSRCAGSPSRFADVG